MAIWSEALPLTTNCLSLPSWLESREKVASDLGLGSGFHRVLRFPLGLGSIAKTSSARLSLMIDTHHLLKSCDELDTLPSNPTSFEPLPNCLIPSKNS